MKTTIFYFSGTGNSLKVAKDIANKLKNCDLVPIASIIDMDCIANKSEKVGFISPLYAFGLPDLMIKFVEKINLPNAKYIFGVITRGANSWGGLDQLDILLRKQSKHLNAGFYIDMPGSYILKHKACSEIEQHRFFNNAEQKISEITEFVKNNENSIEQVNIFFKLFARIYHMLWAKSVNSRDKRFFVDDNCNSCGLCEKICPVDNIIIDNGKPIWQHNCQLCLACIHFCPEKSIQYGTKTKGKKRYHHPDIKADDILKQKVNKDIRQE
jgi:ferredoxin